MNEQFIGERLVRIESSDNVDGIDRVPDEPEKNLDPLGDDVSQDATLLDQTPMGGTVASVRPVDEFPLDEVRVPPEHSRGDSNGRNSSFCQPDGRV